MLCLRLPLHDQKGHRNASLRDALWALKEFNERHEVKTACTDGCGARTTIKRSKIFDPPRVLILYFPRKERRHEVEINYEIYLPPYYHLPFRLNSILSYTNDGRFYADIIDKESGVWRSDQDEDPRRASVAEFNEARRRGHIFVYEREPRTQSRCWSEFS